MNKRTIIGLIVLILAIVSLMTGILYVGYQKSFPKSEEKQLEQTDFSKECYYIRDTDGYVTVYRFDQKTVYEETSIRTSDLSQEIQQELKKGIKAENIGQVYGFLENYSS